MKTLRQLVIEEITGTWIVTANNRPAGYSQLPGTKDYVRLVKDILKHLELTNLIEIKEK